MSLSSALNTAKSSLSATQTQMSLVSRNIANVNTEGATRKYANVVTGSGGRVEITSVSQSANLVLYRNMLDSTSALQQSTVVQNGLSRFDEMIGDIENGRTPAALIGSLSDALNAYATSPNSYEFGRAVADAAGNVATMLTSATDVVDTIRRDADKELVQSATDMNALLAEIEDLNRQIVTGTVGGQDITDISDDRDRAVAELSKYVGLTVQTRGNNDILIYTDSGVTLFDKVPRTVSFSGTYPMVDGQAGNSFRIDGVPVTGQNAMMPIKSGKVLGLVQLRDDVAVTYQGQLDEMARGLISAFKESGATGLDKTGLFTSSVSSLIETRTTLDAGTYTPSSVSAGSSVSFTLNYAGKDYTVPALPADGIFSSADATDAASVRDKLQAMVDSSVGAGKVAVAIDSVTGAISFAAESVGSKVSLGISGLGATTAGLVAGTADTENELVAGLARTILIDPKVAADATTIRDGVNVDYNATNVGGFTDRINALTTALGATQGFASGTDAATGGSLATFAASSTSWLSAMRSEATTDTDYQQTLLDRTKKTLSDETGVNLDTETLLMLDLERSYQASSKVLTTINEMLQSLLDAI